MTETIDILERFAGRSACHANIGEVRGVLTGFEHLTRCCEYCFGKTATWDKIQEITFKTDDEYVQRCMLKYCSYREDDETEMQRYRILVDFIRHDDFKLYQKIVAITEVSAFSHIESRAELFKKIYKEVNEETRQYLSYAIIYNDIKQQDDGTTSTILRAVCDRHDHSYKSVCRTVADVLVPDFGKNAVRDVLNATIKHEYATRDTKNILARILKEVFQ